jgi:hypothetical protein
MRFCSARKQRGSRYGRLIEWRMAVRNKAA